MSKAISIYQPWATMLVRRRHADGSPVRPEGTPLKQLETRPWRTYYRGPLLIHAAKRPTSPRPVHDAANLAERLDQLARLTVELLRVPLDQLPTGCIVGQAELLSCLPTDGLQPGPHELALGNYAPGRWAWAFDAAVEYPTPVPARGRQRLWTPEPAAADAALAAFIEAGRLEYARRGE